MERTFAYLKPNSIQRGLVGEILAMVESKGLKIVGLKMLFIEDSQARELYREHAGKDFYEPLLKFIKSGPVVAMVLEGEMAVKTLRSIVGKTDPLEAEPGSVRGKYGVTVRKNMIHASDSPENALREMNIFFAQSELMRYSLVDESEL